MVGRSVIILLLVGCPLVLTAQGDSVVARVGTQDTVYVTPDSTRFALPIKKRPWLAAAEAEGLNLSLLAFDHYVLDAKYAKVTSHTLWRNLKLNQWFWDADRAYTNLLEHPYHGSLYFSAARSNGLPFWQSVPYTVGGSLLWEIAGECELPSVNDWASTSLGGIAIGEVLHRVSSLVLDDSRRGKQRVIREVAGTLIDPFRGLNRIIRGDAWHVRDRQYLYHDPSAIPVSVNINGGWRHTQLHGKEKISMNTGFLEADVRYGDIADTRYNKPYDYFESRLRLVAGSGQKLVNHASITGRLTAWPLHEGRHSTLGVGLFQHFNYLSTDSIHHHDFPYMLSETASAGPSIFWQIRSVSGQRYLDQALHMSGILMGGSKSDWTGSKHARDYNLGSGFSVKWHAYLHLGDRLAIGCHTDYYRLYTWKGYEDTHYKEADLKTSAQGDEGCTWMLVVNPTVDLHIAHGWGLRFAGDYLLRHTSYRYHPYVKSHALEARIGLLYTLSL